MQQKDREAGQSGGPPKKATNKVWEEGFRVGPSRWFVAVPLNLPTISSSIEPANNKQFLKKNHFFLQTQPGVIPWRKFNDSSHIYISSLYLPSACDITYFLIRRIWPGTAKQPMWRLFRRLQKAISRQMSRFSSRFEDQSQFCENWWPDNQ